MKVSIIGSSSGTGRALADKLVTTGHEVVAVSRSGNVPPRTIPVTGSATDPDIIAEAIRDCDAVVVTVGGAKKMSRNRAAVTRVIIDAMTHTGPSRLIVHSSLGAGDSGALMPVPIRWIAKAMLAGPLADHNLQEARTMSSGLDWTIVRPSGLTDKPASGYITAEVSDDGYIGRSISRHDVADFIATCLTDESTIGRAFGIAGR